MNMDFFRIIGKDNVLLILNLLEIDDVLVCGRVNILWNKFHADSFLWRSLFFRDFNLRWPFSATNPIQSYCEAFYAKKSLKANFDVNSKVILQYSEGDDHNSYREGVNCANHLIAYCYRGQVEKINKFFEDPDSQQWLNAPQKYTEWSYYGNYSACDASFIKQELKLHPNGKLREYYTIEVTDRRSQYASKNVKTHVLAHSGCPLHWATLSGQFEVVKLLCEKGADPNLKIKALGVNAKDIALANGFFEIYDYLAQKF